MYDEPNLVQSILNIPAEEALVPAQMSFDDVEEGDSQPTEIQILRETADVLEKLEKTAPRMRKVELAPDKEISYKQKYIPQCRMCNSHLREEAEAVYVQNNFVANRVVKWIQSTGEHFTWECISTHMKNHCVWDKPLINFIERINSRQDELSIIKQDRIKFTLDSLATISLDLLSGMESSNKDDAIKIYNAICNGAKAQSQLMKLQHDTIGAEAQARAIVESNNKKLFNFLDRLLGVVGDNEKLQIMELIRDFQGEEVKKII